MLNVWAFLRVGMGLSTKQASGICGNIYNESAFSSDNAENTSYPGIHNPEYKYSVNDGVGYGLIQWTHYSRKKGLETMAKDMELSVSNINVQLAYLRSEMTISNGENPNLKKAWDKICKSNSYTEVSDIYLEKIENPTVYNYDERRKFSQTIYHYMKKH